MSSERGKRLTIDHFTPRCIGKALGWSHNQINAPENLQFLSWDEHRDKDFITPLFLTRVTQMKAGRTVTLWEHNNERIMFERKMSVKTAFLYSLDTQNHKKAA